MNSIHFRLKTKFNKLNHKIQQLVQKGRFQQFTAFKQQQLLGRLQRYSFQLKQLGIGVAIVSALGYSNSAHAQFPPPFQTVTGSNSPFNTLPSFAYRPTFVDIDNDGDLDLFGDEYSMTTGLFSPAYYENTGTAANPVYTQRTGTANPLDNENILNLSFGDIDNDGDLDVIGGIDFSSSAAQRLVYYENTGTATNPTFVQRTGNNNPFDNVSTAVSSSLNSHIYPNFIDLNDDNALDIVIGYTGYQQSTPVKKLFYYENTGSVQAPQFTEQTGNNNPFNNIPNDFSQPITSSGQCFVTFSDFDLDNDQDVFVHAPFPGGDKYRYYENLGNSVVPVYATSTINPLVNANLNAAHYFVLIDYDNDTDLDVLARENIWLLKENQDANTPTNISNITNSSTQLEVFPNPSTNHIYFEEAQSGTLDIYDLSGKAIHQEILQDQQKVNLNHLQNGSYILTLKTKDNYFRNMLMIQK